MTRIVIVSASSKRALIEHAKTVKCDRFAILSPYPSSDGTHKVLRVVDGKEEKIINPTSWYEGLDCEIAEKGKKPSFNWTVCVVSIMKGNYGGVYPEVTGYKYMNSTCPPRSRNDGTVMKSWSDW